MAGRQRHDLSALANEKPVGGDNERAGAKLDKLPEGCVDFAFCAGTQDMQLQPERTRCIPHTFCFGLGKGVIRIDLATAAEVRSNSCSTSSGFASSSTARPTKPVTLLPGRLRPATRPICTGSWLLRRTTIYVARTLSNHAPSPGRIACQSLPPGRSVPRKRRPLRDGAIDTGVEIKGDQLAGVVARKVHGGGNFRRACESMKDLRDCLPARCGKKASVWSRP